MNVIHALVEITQAAENLRANLMEQRNQYKDVEIPDWLRDSLSFCWTIECKVATIGNGIDDLITMMKEAMDQ